MKKLVLSLCCLAFFCALDGGFLTLQVAAWIKMASVFSQQDSLPVALKKTFDGAHPCQVCKQIAKFNSNSPRLASPSADGKSKLSQLHIDRALVPSSQSDAAAGSSNFVWLPDVELSVPTPPPRVS